MPNVILTGIPRAGTTLVASRIDAEKNSICLNEPEWQRPGAGMDAGAFADAIAKDFEYIRKDFLAGVAVPDKRAPDGSAVTNYYEDGTDIAEYPLVRQGLTDDFTLAIKHNGPYLAALPELISLGTFEVRAVIRDPLPVLRSWRRLDVPVSRGEMPNAASCWPQMREIIEAKIPLLEKQARMLDEMFSRIHMCEKYVTLLRYEDIAEGSAQRSAKDTDEDAVLLQAVRTYAPHAAVYYPA